MSIQFRIRSANLMEWNHPKITEKAPVGRQRHTACLVGSKKLYILGGFDGYKWLNDLHILGIGVLKDYRNQSIAKKLTQELISYFEISQFDKILLEVRESNEAAVNLYQSFGFKQYGVRKNYYVNEDAKLFQREKIYA